VTFPRTSAVFPVIKLALATACLLASGASGALTLGVTEGVTYRSSEKEIAAKFEPIAEALSKALKQPVNVRVIPAYNDLRAALKQQQVDIAFVHPAHVALEAVKAGTYRTVAWTSGFTEYKVSFLCKDSKPIESWGTVRGKAIATPDPDSITAVMTRALLREKGLAQGAVQLQTTRYQEAVPFFVEKDFTSYGATASKAVVKQWKDDGGKICAESKGLPIKHWIVSSNLEPGLAKNVRESLLALSTTEAGKRALATSTYTGMVAPSEDTEKALIVWLGL
jgi:phosphonate transport system substrate-binding protein